MTPATGRQWGTAQRMAGIMATSIAMGLVILYIGRSLAEPGEPVYPPVAVRAGPGDPIRAEADAYRVARGERVEPLDARRREGAQPRSLAMHRSLRAYPGAPPRIPHGLTDEEFRTARCNTCHERGGFSPRFAAYAPVTPHPGWTDCLQCHVADGNLVGIGFPDRAGGAVCLQCHTSEVGRPTIALVDWPEPAWPRLGGRAMDGAPPWIPHELDLRGDCLACHAGPAAVAEIRTSHPERADCRQCHVPAPADATTFARPPDATSPAPGGDL